MKSVNKKALQDIEQIHQVFKDKLSIILAERDKKIAQIISRIEKRQINKIEQEIKKQI